MKNQSNCKKVKCMDNDPESSSNSTCSGNSMKGVTEKHEVVEKIESEPGSSKEHTVVLGDEANVRIPASDDQSDSENTNKNKGEDPDSSDGDASDDDDLEEVGGFVQEHGLRNHQYSIAIDLHQGPVQLEENEDNLPVLTTLKDHYRLISTKHQPSVTRWLQVRGSTIDHQTSVTQW